MYWIGAHTKHKHMYHIVWIPKYRKSILKEKLTERIEELLQECAEVNGWQIHELNVQVDHVHMFVQLRPSVSVSRAVQYFKGGVTEL